MTASTPDVIVAFEKHLMADLAAKVEEWSRCRQELTRWEDEHLLVENPPPENLAEHKRMLERLMFFGQIFTFVTSQPDFPDIELAELVHANQFIFREKFQMFHNPMSREQAERILQEFFPEP